MAQFLNQKKPARLPSTPNTGFNALGKPVSYERQRAGDDALKNMGVSNAEDRINCVRIVVARLERDGDTYRATEDAMKFVDLTGAYRLISTLLCA